MWQWVLDANVSEEIPGYVLKIYVIRRQNDQAMIYDMMYLLNCNWVATQWQ
jgi:hypothetical protein